MILEIVRDDYISLGIKDGLFIAQAELSKMDDDIVSRAIKTTKTNWMFFNRLIVPVPLRGKGYSTALLKRLRQLVKERKFNVINTANAYGDMTQQDLESLYEKHGFVRVFDNVFTLEAPLLEDTHVK